MAKQAIVTLKSAAVYHQSQQIFADKLPKETHPDFEDRTWRDRCHADAEGNCYIPSCQFRNCLTDAAKFLARPIPGDARKTWSKHFAAGIVMPKEVGIYLGVKKDVAGAKVSSPLGTQGVMLGKKISVPSDGRAGGGKRVVKTFPMFIEWEGEIEFWIYDDAITEDAFRSHLIEAGRLIGVGAFRPINRGWCGRFEVVNCKWNNDFFETTA